MKVMSEKTKQRQMGEVSNLITDMTLKVLVPPRLPELYDTPWSLSMP